MASDERVGKGRSMGVAMAMGAGDHGSAAPPEAKRAASGGSERAPSRPPAGDVRYSTIEIGKVGEDPP